MSDLMFACLLTGFVFVFLLFPVLKRVGYLLLAALVLLSTFFKVGALDEEQDIH